MPVWVPTTWTQDKLVNLEDASTAALDRFELSKDYVDETFDALSDFITDLEILVFRLDLPEAEIDAIGEIPIPDIDGLSYEDRPKLEDIEFPDVPTNTALVPDWVAYPSFDDLDFPTLNADPPEFVTPTKPDHDSITEPGDPPAIDAIDYPGYPEYELPTPPEFEGISFPAPPTITIPEFEGTVPTEDWTLPGDFSYDEAEYGSDIWADLMAKVLNDIRNGGTGLDVDVETDIYNRGLARQEAENERFYEEVEDYFEARGFDLPVGALAARLYEAGREVSHKNDLMNYEVTINQAELAQKNTHFAIEKGIALEGILRDFFNAQATRAFEAARAVFSAGIDIFNARVNKFNARVALYQAQAAAFESRVRAALVEAEIFKTKVEACKVTVESQAVLADIYKTRIEAIDVIVKAYATEMESARIKADVERTRIEIYRSQVQAYLARIEADKAKFDVYVKELEAEQTKAQVYSEQVKAYLGEIEATKSEYETQLAKADLVLKQNQLLSDQYKAELAGYEASMSGYIANVSSLADIQKAAASAYSAETEAEGSWFRAKVEEMRTQVSRAGLLLDQAKAEAAAALSGFESINNLRMKGTESLMNVGAQLVASAMNAVTATASINYTATESSTESWSHEEGITESHPYEDAEAASQTGDDE